MHAPSTFRRVAAVLDELEDSGVDVRSVSTPAQTVESDGTLVVEVTAAVPVFDSVGTDGAVRVTTPDGAAVRDGSMTFGFEIEIDVNDTGPPRVERRGEGAQSATEDASESTDGTGTADTDTSGSDATTSAETTAESSGTSETTEEPAETEGESQAAETSETADAETSDVETPETSDVETPETAGNEAPETTTQGGEEASAEDTPAHRNPERLREVYEQEETFKGMREALGADVTPQTVRHHMIKHGIHEPEQTGPTKLTNDGSDATENSGSAAAEDVVDDHTAVEPETETDDDSEATETIDEPDDPGRSNGSVAASPTADGTEFEDRSAEELLDDLDDLDVEILAERDLSVLDIREAVMGSSTLYETYRRLDLDRETATRILRELNLLDLVTGRLATREDREVNANEIDTRLLDAAGPEATDAGPEAGDA